ncbi:MAG: hypothetical protein ABID64_04405 [Nitrospirota bacterium]
MIKFIKKYIGELVTLVGVTMTSYNMFGLFNVIHYKKSKSVPEGTDFDFSILEHIYSDTQTILITIGIVLIVTGIFIIRSRK